MKIKPFAVEEWMNAYETGARFNIAETCVDSVSLDQLFALTGQDREAFWTALSACRLTYGEMPCGRGSASSTGPSSLTRSSPPTGPRGPTTTCSAPWSLPGTT